MKKKDIPANAYALTSSQNSMYMMIKYSIHKNVMQVPTSLAVNQKLDPALLQRAVELELERNDSLRLRFFKEGGELKQYFLPQVTPENITVKHFSSQAEQDAFLEADAQVPVRFLKGEIFRLVLFTTHDGKTGIYFNVSHLAMDAMAVAIFYVDLLAIYASLAGGTDMPEPLYPFEEAVKNDLAYLADKERYEKDKSFYLDYWKDNGEPFYAAVHGPALLEQQRKKTKNPNLRVPTAYDPLHDKCEIISHHVGAEDARKIYEFCRDTKNAPENIIMLGMRTHCSSINYRTPDVLMMPLCSRRVTYKTKRMGGCLAQPLQLHTVIEEDKTFTQALATLFSVRTQLYRHSNFPYLHARALQQKVFGYKMSQGPSCMMYTWLPLFIPSEHGWEFEFKGYNPGRYVMPLYAFSLPNMKDNGMDFYYMYRPNLISAEDIDALHKNCIRVMLKGIENPDITIGKLMDSIS